MVARRYKVLLGLLMLAGPPPAAAQERRAPETVIILHGMARTRASMLVLVSRFKRAGYETLNFPYQTATTTLPEISDSLAEFVEKNVRTERYHLVGHSLGNIIVRNAMKKKLRPGLGRVVMLAPPNKPARLAKMFRDNLLFRWVTGDAGRKLGEDEFYKTLPVPPVEFGVIAGDTGQKLTFDGPNDGIVDVEGTKLEGMKAHAVLHHTHTFLMNGSDTFELSKRFLETGSFTSADAARR